MKPEVILWLPVGLVGLLYLAVMLTITRGWFRLKPVKTTVTHARVSVVISARNEAENIVQCLSSISRQEYPATLFEIIVADDASDDNTAERVIEFARANPQLNLKLIQLKAHGGKKTALRTALDQASGDYALTTDADCFAGPDWISSMVSALEEKNSVFVSGPVDFKTGSLINDLFYGLEFMSLIASGAGAIGAGFPIMCNGANMGFSLKHFRALQLNALHDQFASGEDVFLMQAFKKQSGSHRITFARSTEAMVYTHPPRNLKHFFRQRLRWTSKSIAYRDIATILTAIAVLLINLTVSVLMIASCFDLNYLLPALITIGIKTVIDLPLLTGYALFSGKLFRIAAIVPAEPLVALYTTFTGLAGHFINVKWKGKPIRKNMAG